MNTIERQIAVAYVVSEDDKLLLGKKAPGGGGVYPDCLHNPGGGIEEGETGEQAVQRELLEESGIDAARGVLELVDNAGTGTSVKTLTTGEQVAVNMRFMIYRLTLDIPSSMVKLTETGDLIEFDWYPVSKIQTFPLTPPAKELLERIGTDWLETNE